MSPMITQSCKILIDRIYNANLTESTIFTYSFVIIIHTLCTETGYKRSEGSTNLDTLQNLN